MQATELPAAAQDSPSKLIDKMKVLYKAKFLFRQTLSDNFFVSFNSALSVIHNPSKDVQKEIEEMFTLLPKQRYRKIIPLINLRTFTNLKITNTLKKK